MENIYFKETEVDQTDAQWSFARSLTGKWSAGSLTWCSVCNNFLRWEWTRPRTPRPPSSLLKVTHATDRSQTRNRPRPPRHTLFMSQSPPARDSNVITSVPRWSLFNWTKTGRSSPINVSVWVECVKWNWIERPPQPPPVSHWNQFYSSGGFNLFPPPREEIILPKEPCIIWKTLQVSLWEFV